MELFKASRQWAERPADQRFWDLEEMISACEGYRRSAVEAETKADALRVEADGSEVILKGKKEIPARLTHWSFGQIARIAGAPASYLRTLPATLAAQNINHGLAHGGPLGDKDGKLKLLFHRNGDMLLRCATSDVYSRVWNADIGARLQLHLPEGWRVPPARPAGIVGERTRQATAQDVLQLQKSGLSVREGDLVAPAGLYASDHDMFVFMVNEDRTVNDGTGHGLGRGFFLWNSEVGAMSFGVTSFLYDAVCGNHIVWGARDVKEVRIRHVGSADEKAFRGIRMELVKYADSSASDMEAVIRRARAFEFGKTKEEAVDAVLAFATKAKAGVSRANVENAYAVAEKAERYGSPRSAWGIVNGLTELSQETVYADNRLALDRAAGKILQVVEF